VFIFFWGTFIQVLCLFLIVWFFFCNYVFWVPYIVWILSHHMYGLQVFVSFSRLFLHSDNCFFGCAKAFLVYPVFSIQNHWPGQCHKELFPSVFFCAYFVFKLAYINNTRDFIVIIPYIHAVYFVQVHPLHYISIAPFLLPSVLHFYFRFYIELSNPFWVDYCIWSKKRVLTSFFCMWISSFCIYWNDHMIFVLHCWHL
jgi:hypothetical protein